MGLINEAFFCRHIVTGGPWPTSEIQTIAHLKRWQQEVQRRPSSSVDRLIWKGNAGPAYLMSNFVCSLKEAAPKTKPCFRSAFPSSSVGLWCHILCIDFQGKWMPLPWDMSVIFSIATTAALIGQLTKKGKASSHSRGSMEQRTEQDKGNRSAN